MSLSSIKWHNSCSARILPPLPRAAVPTRTQGPIWVKNKLADCKCQELSRQVFEMAINAAQQAGEIPPDKDAEDLSRFLVNSLCGLKVLGKLSRDPEFLNSVVDQILGHLE